MYLHSKAIGPCETGVIARLHQVNDLQRIDRWFWFELHKYRFSARVDSDDSERLAGDAQTMTFDQCSDRFRQTVPARED